MGRRGPPRTSTEVLKQRGSPLAKEREAEQRAAPQPGRGIPEMPAGMDPAARAIWRRLAPALDEMGVLTTNDGDLLGRYCVTLARWRKAARVLQTKGETYDTLSTKGHPLVKPRPEVNIVRSLGIELLKIEDRFGMSPTARSRLNVNAIFQASKRQPSPEDKPASDAGGDTKPNVIRTPDRFFKPA